MCTSDAICSEDFEFSGFCSPLSQDGAARTPPTWPAVDPAEGAALVGMVLGLDGARLNEEFEHEACEGWVPALNAMGAANATRMCAALQTEGF